MTTVLILDPRTTPDVLGLLPGMIDENDPRSAREQFDANYQHGGGWRPMGKFRLGKDARLYYPGDPPLERIAMMRLRDELIFFYPYAWVAIVQPDGSFEVARMD